MYCKAHGLKSGSRHNESVFRDEIRCILRPLLVLRIS
jgi:hypothetical protein